VTNYHTINGTVVQDFARRTLANLEYIEAQRNNRDVYEVTQLINSLLGLLVFPQQRFWERIKPVPLSELPWAEFHMRTGHDRCTDLQQLVRYVRNSVSHFNVDFGRETGEIKQIEMWNYNPRTERVDWRADITVEGLRDFAYHFILGVMDGSFLENDGRS